MREQEPTPAKSVFSAAKMRKLGAEPCATCDVIPGFVPSGALYEGKQLHVFECLTCGEHLGDFLEPNDQDEGIKHWNDKQRERRSELADPFDRDWYESQIAPVLHALAKKIERAGRGASLSTIRSKAQLAVQLTSLDELASEIAATASALRGEFAKRHEPVTKAPSGRS